MGRESQPYRRGARLPSDALRAMLKGRTSTGYNPQDLKRAAMLTAAARKRRQAVRRPLPKRRPLPPRG